MLERFWEKVEVGPEDFCWDWLACTEGKGYGYFFTGRRYSVAHRVAYEVSTGKQIPVGLTLDHLCRNRRCCNPKHLEPVTVRTNTLRGLAPSAVNAFKTHCIHGHPFDQENTYWEPRTLVRRCKACGRERKRRKARVA